MTPVTILLNRGSGRVRASRDFGATVADLFRANGMEPAVELISGGECMARSRAISERGDELLVVGGGDGTVSAAASALVGTETMLGILPLGTLNHFA
ncbi:MAG TPA: diacylglycerol kinase family protein, partial [Sphingomicrobium sp.]|nr:diacylglycerol kinase family protein [Sphingomicrobium sp.]